MKKLMFGAALALLGASAAFAQDATLKTPADFASITNEQERSVAIFTEMGKVLEHPRCVNCHPVTGAATQGNDLHPHNPPIERGDGDFGVAGMNCNACHGPKNIPFQTGAGTMPGAEDTWMMAPVSLGWRGKSLGEICAILKDENATGGDDLNAVDDEIASNTLIGWAWDAGGRDEPAGSQAEFAALTRAWIDTGAACPSP